MKRIKSLNGYTIYEATTQRDADNYNCEAGSYNIYLSTDIRDFGLRNSYPEYENIDSLAVALAMCSDSHYGVAVALADELSDSTVQDMDLTLEIERRLESGEALETIRRCYDRETGRLYESISDAIAHGFDPYADDFDPYEDHPSVGYDEDGKPHIVEDECEWDDDDLDGDLEDVFETAVANGDLADQNLDYDYDETDLLRRAMCAAGYAYDGLNSDGHLAFYDEMCEHIYFLTWPAVREWLEGVVFDDPEVSIGVERILHPERFIDEEPQTQTFKVQMVSAGGIRRDLYFGLTEQEALDTCESYGWEYCDENGFVWSLDYTESSEDWTPPEDTSKYEVPDLAGYDFGYDMADWQGETCTVYGHDDGPAYVMYYDFEANAPTTKQFTSEEKAYNWAYNHGYRD